MHVDRAEARNREDRARNDLAVGDDHQKVRRRSVDPLHGLRVAYALRLIEGQAQLLRRHLDRRGRHLHPPAGGAIGLSDDQQDLVAGRMQRSK